MNAVRFGSSPRNRRLSPVAPRHIEKPAPSSTGRRPGLPPCWPTMEILSGPRSERWRGRG